MNKLGVFSLLDLISYFPRRYEDRSSVKPIALVQDGESACISAVVADEPRLSRIRRGLEVVRLRVYDDSAEVTVTYFNQSHVRNQLHRGSVYRFYGKMEVKGSRRSLTNPVFESEELPAGRMSVTGRIVPVYRLSSGLQQNALRQSIRQGLDSCRGQIPELLPESVRTGYGLMAAEDAYESIHFPQDIPALDHARKRFVFEELFLLSCALGSRQKAEHAGIVLPEPDFRPFFESLPFSPTGAQRRAIEEAASDMASGRQMSRLLQGDVGSGKTLVAAALVWQCFRAGYAAAFMAPTEILAAQHYETFQKLLEGTGVTVGLLTGSLRESDKKRVRSGLADGTIQLVIGTHALITDKTEFNNLGLAVTDEQHRFGVAQRAKLLSKGDNPHLLVMSATPIPRTLGLIIFGDLDISVIDELPPNRKPVRTVLLPASGRGRIYKFIREEVSRGRQAYIVCPLVEEGELEGVASAEEYAAELMLKHFPDIPVGVVHGKLKPAEKDAVMDGFARNEYKILVATTVIEVGVDVPNASVMLIENAERFGLSQLHQLRGRVGRGDAQSFCVMISDRMNQVTRQRLEVMCSTNDGFKIADEDLKMRGPGDFFGERQHGLPQLAIADFADTKSLELSQKIADEIMFRYKDLRSDELRLLNAEIDRLFSRGGHNTMN